MLTISIGSGKKADAQFLFAEDILGHSSIDFPRHAKMYRNFRKIENLIQKERVNAFKEFANDVKNLKFPQKKHSVKIEKTELRKFKDKLSKLSSK
jgi:3-methyl-2-oxobutanoate hydroxymethyltransferase